MDELNFNALEFNLYELLNLPTTCTCIDVKKKFKKLIKLFHPDKISNIEEKIYYNITIAHHVLSNEEFKKRYDDWLIGSHKSHLSLKNSFNDTLVDMHQYFPHSKEEAAVLFQQSTRELEKRHGEFKEDKRKLHDIYKEKQKERTKVTVTKEEFTSIDDFNKKFTDRKNEGLYCDKIVKRTTDIQPYTFGTSSNYTELNDFNNIYKQDSPFQYVFDLMPIIDHRPNNKTISQRMSEYNEQINISNNNYKNILDGLNF